MQNYFYGNIICILMMRMIKFKNEKIKKLFYKFLIFFKIF